MAAGSALSAAQHGSRLGYQRGSAWQLPRLSVRLSMAAGSTTLASHAFMLVLRAVKERGMLSAVQLDEHAESAAAGQFSTGTLVRGGPPLLRRKSRFAMA